MNSKEVVIQKLEAETNGNKAKKLQFQKMYTFCVELQSHQPKWLRKNVRQNDEISQKKQKMEDFKSFEKYETPKKKTSNNISNNK